MSDLIRRSDAISIIQNAKYKYPTWPHIVEAKKDMVRDIKSAPTIAPASLITGETSDGYHTFNELYHHRAVLLSVICNDRPKMAWKSKKHHDGTMFDGMFIVGIQTPEGQATYHYDIDPYWERFLVPELLTAPEWDGHTPARAIERIGRLAQSENKPLTLDEMNALDHEPIYVLHTYDKWGMDGWHIATSSSHQNHGRCDLEIDNGNTIIDMQNYGITWFAYRSRPKEATND